MSDSQFSAMEAEARGAYVVSIIRQRAKRRHAAEEVDLRMNYRHVSPYACKTREEYARKLDAALDTLLDVLFSGYGEREDES